MPLCTYVCTLVYLFREQYDREQALDDFKTGSWCHCVHALMKKFLSNSLHLFFAGRVSILIATDVASRGLDIKDIRFVWVIVNHATSVMCSV